MQAGARTPLALRWPGLYRENFLIGTSLARIGFGLLILYMYLIHYNQRYLLWSDKGLIDHESYTAAQSIPLSLYVISPSLTYFNIVFHLGLLVTFLYIIGWRGRLTSILFFIFTYSLMDRNHMISDGGDNILRILLFYLMFANTTAYFSMDAESYWNKRPLQEGRTSYHIKSLLHNLAVLCCIINLCIMYLSSGLYQVMGEMWHSGTAVYYIMQVDQFSNPFYRNLVLQNDYLIVIFTYASILVKIAFPFLLFNRYTKYFIVLCVIGFHAGIGVAMGLVSFSATMCIIDFLLISDKDYLQAYHFFGRLSRRIRLSLLLRTRKAGTSEALQAQRVIVFYDSWCPFCRASVRNLQRLDWFRLLRFHSFRDPAVRDLHQLDLAKAEKRMHSKQASASDLHEGIDAFIQIGKRLVPLAPAVPFLYAARAAGIGQRIYDYIASRRTIIPAGGCDDACPIPAASAQSEAS